jgi:hypothetical protein
VFGAQLRRTTGFEKDVADADSIQDGWRGAGEHVANGAGETADDAVLLDGEQVLGPSCGAKDQIVIDRLERGELDHRTRDSVAAQALGRVEHFAGPIAIASSPPHTTGESSRPSRM